MRRRRGAVSGTEGASADLQEATRATFVSFTANGFAFANTVHPHLATLK